MTWKASVVTYADLGDRENLKTRAIQPLLNELKHQKKLHQVLYRFGRSSRTEEIALLNIFVAGLIKAAKKLLPKEKARYIEEVILDRLASAKLEPGLDVVIVHPIRFPRAIEKAHSAGARSVLVATTAHPITNANIVKQEAALLGISMPKPKLDGIRDSVIEKADHIIALSDFVKESYILNGVAPCRISIASLNVDWLFFSPSEKGAKKVFRVFYPAAGSPLTRGLVYLLEAWKKLNFHGKELVLAGNVYGSNIEYNRILKNYIKDDSSIHILGVLGKKEMRREYRSSDLVVLPSLTEGFAKTVHEAMACGKPVITTENARALVRDGRSGFVVPVRDSAAIKSRIEEIRQRPELGFVLGCNAREEVKSKISFGKEVVKVCDDLLGKKRFGR